MHEICVHNGKQHVVICASCAAFACMCIICCIRMYVHHMLHSHVCASYAASACMCIICCIRMYVHHMLPLPEETRSSYILRASSLWLKKVTKRQDMKVFVEKLFRQSKNGCRRNIHSSKRTNTCRCSSWRMHQHASVLQCVHAIAIDAKLLVGTKDGIPHRDLRAGAESSRATLAQKH
jgi:hypothetical protein